MTHLRLASALLLVVLASACGRDALLLPEAAAPPIRTQQMGPGGGDEAPGAFNRAGSTDCEGEWVSQMGPDGTPILVCVGPHQGSGG